MNRRLSAKQWLSMVILTVACVIQKMRPTDEDGGSTEERGGQAPPAPQNQLQQWLTVLYVGSDLLFILLQVVSIILITYKIYVFFS